MNANRFLFFLLVCIIFEIHADQQYVLKLQKEASTLAQTTSPSFIPGFKTDMPPEVNLDDRAVLEEKTAHATHTSEASKFLKNSAENRPYFKLDLDTDPVVKNSVASIANPQQVLSQSIRNRTSHTFYETMTCLESKPDTLITCSKSLLPPEFTVEPPKYSHWWCTSGAHPSPDDPNCQAKAYYNPPKMYQAERIHILKETWTSSCQALEEKTQLGICRLIKKECPAGRETRDVTGTLGGKSVTRPITRDCWRYELTYSCSYPSINTCDPLRKKGCEQIGSECAKEIAGIGQPICVEWKQTLRCATIESTESFDQKSSALDAPYEIPASSSKVQGASEGSSEADFYSAISKLHILQEAQNHLRAEGSSTSVPLIFKGQSKACTIAFANFKDCCGGEGGWGTDLGISGCSGEEKDLSARKSQNLCHEIGTYCAERFAGLCIRKKRRYCCFSSKLSKILHEQGRAQLNMSWGSAEDPECRGFTADELSRLNFDRLDLREIYAEIASRMQSSQINVANRNLSERVKHMTHAFKNKPSGGVQ